MHSEKIDGVSERAIFYRAVVQRFEKEGLPLIVAWNGVRAAASNPIPSAPDASSARHAQA